MEKMLALSVKLFFCEILKDKHKKEDNFFLLLSPKDQASSIKTAVRDTHITFFCSSNWPQIFSFFISTEGFSQKSSLTFREQSKKRYDYCYKAVSY